MTSKGKYYDNFFYNEELLDSDCERLFISALNKVVNCNIFQQFKVAGYKIDFVIEKNNKLIGIEIDGKQHRLQNDSLRDKRILKTGKIFKIIRIPANYIYKNRFEAIQRFIADKFPEYFNLKRIEMFIASERI
jgi:very-short-patch-repair endonuclease